MVVFVGPNKAGTTFVVNAIAHAMANAKIMTSILDMTRDKGMWYIYSQQYTTSMQKKMANYMQRVSDGEGMVDSIETLKEKLNDVYKVLKESGDWIQVRHHKLSSGITGWWHCCGMLQQPANL